MLGGYFVAKTNYRGDVDDALTVGLFFFFTLLLLLLATVLLNMVEAVAASSSSFLLPPFPIGRRSPHLSLHHHHDCH